MFIFSAFHRFITPILSLAFCLVQPVWSLPQGAQVEAGSVVFERDATSTTVHQASPRAIVNYSSFNITGNESVRFQQPSASASILNRVNGPASTIAGSLSANGNVVLVNPQGILFTPTARVNTHGLIASGLQMSSADFMAGNMRFTGPGGSVVNQGSISANRAWLIGGRVDNQGSIASPNTVLAAASQSVVIDQAAGGTISVFIDGVQTGPNGQALPDDSSDASDQTSTPNLGEGDTDGTENSEPTDAADLTQENDSEPSTEGGSTIENLTEAGAGDGDNASITASQDLEGFTDGDVINRGVIDASGDERGGRIVASGSRVSQQGEAIANGGQGSGGEIQLIARELVEVGSESRVIANAGLDGVGGDVTVYSEGIAVLSQGATVETRGGTLSGDGGFVEVSGREFVDVQETIDASAANGRVGRLLIDPDNIEIIPVPPAGGDDGVVSTPASGSDPFSYTPAGPESKLQDSILYTQLNSADVDVVTDGNITWSAGSDYAGAQNQLSLDATTGLILIQAPLRGDMSVNLNAGTEVVLSNVIDIEGDLDVTAGTTIGSSFGNAPITTGGNIIMLATGDIDLQNNPILGADNLSLRSETGSIVAPETVDGFGNATVNNISIKTEASPAAPSSSVGDIVINQTMGATSQISLDSENNDVKISDNIFGQDISIQGGASVLFDSPSSATPLEVRANNLLDVKSPGAITFEDTIASGQTIRIANDIGSSSAGLTLGDNSMLNGGRVELNVDSYTSVANSEILADESLFVRAQSDAISDGQIIVGPNVNSSGDALDFHGESSVEINGNVNVNNGSAIIHARVILNTSEEIQVEQGGLSLGAGQQVRLESGSKATADNGLSIFTTEANGSIASPSSDVVILDAGSGDVILDSGLIELTTANVNGAGISVSSEGDALLGRLEALNQVVINSGGTVAFSGDVGGAGGGGPDQIVVNAASDILAQPGVQLSANAIGLESYQGSVGTAATPIDLQPNSQLALRSASGTFVNNQNPNAEVVTVDSQAAGQIQFVSTPTPSTSTVQDPETATAIVAITPPPNDPPAVNPEPPVILPEPPVVIVPEPEPEPEPELDLEPELELEPEPEFEPEPEPEIEVAAVEPVLNSTPIAPQNIEDELVEAFDGIFLLDTALREQVDAETREFVQRVQESVIQDAPDAQTRVVQFREFYFLHHYMQVSEFSLDLDLNFIDYLLFGSANLTAGPDLPKEAKRVIYIGGEKPYRF